MIIETVTVTDFATNCYILGCDKTYQGMVIDPGGDAPTILAAIAASGLEIKYILNTHGHIDHISANAAIKAATGAKLLIHHLDAPMLTDPQLNLGFFMGQNETSPRADKRLEAGEVLTVGSLRLLVLHTPGHTPGGIALYAAEQGTLFAGDTLFRGSIGRSDFPGGDHDQLVQSISRELLTLPDQTLVYPGHGPPTTIGEERRHNPWLQASAL